MKSEKKGRFPSIINAIGTYVVGIIAVLFAFFISTVSMFHTTYIKSVDENNVINSAVYNIKQNVESAIYYNDNFILNFIVLAVSIMILSIAAAKIKKFKLRYNIIFIFVWTVLLSTIWVLSSQSSPSEDSWVVTTASQNFSNGDYSALTGDDRYMKNYSFQLGYVFFNEIIMRIAKVFKPKTLLYLEVINGIFLAIINMFILFINDKLFDDKRINNVTTIILAISVAPIIACSFIYGIYPGMAFAIIALYCEIKYLKDDKIVFAILSILSITVAVMIKSNYLIWLIAMLVVAFIVMFKRKKYLFDIIFMILATVCSMVIQPTIKSMYESRSGAELGDSVPYVSWIAMGLNEADNAPGWYNISYTVSNFESNDFNAKKASAASKKEIKNRIKTFSHDRQYFNDFFYLKTVSQWNDTSYESIWNNVVRLQYKDKGKIAGWVCNKGCNATRKWMDWTAQLVFFAFLVGCIALIKRKNFIELAFPLIVIGGFMYQTISEGKSQYIMPYFILLSGFAGFGIVCIYDKFLKDRFKIFTEKQVPAVETASEIKNDSADSSENSKNIKEVQSENNTAKEQEENHEKDSATDKTKNKSNRKGKNQKNK